MNKFDELQNIPSKARRLFRIEVNLNGHEPRLNRRVLFDEIVKGMPKIQCIVSYSVSGNIHELRLFLDTNQTCEKSRKPEYILYFIKNIINNLTLTKKQMMQISILKYLPKSRAIKWATNDYHPCYTKNFDKNSFSEMFRIEDWARDNIYEKFNANMSFVKFGGHSKTKKYLKDYLEEKQKKNQANIVNQKK